MSSFFQSYTDWKGGDEYKAPGYAWGTVGHEGGEFLDPDLLAYYASLHGNTGDSTSTAPDDTWGETTPTQDDPWSDFTPTPTPSPGSSWTSPSLPSPDSSGSPAIPNTPEGSWGDATGAIGPQVDSGWASVANPSPEHARMLEPDYSSTTTMADAFPPLTPQQQEHDNLAKELANMMELRSRPADDKTPYTPAPGDVWGTEAKTGGVTTPTGDKTPTAELPSYVPKPYETNYFDEGGAPTTTPRESTGPSFGDIDSGFNSGDSFSPQGWGTQNKETSNTPFNTWQDSTFINDYNAPTPEGGAVNPEVYQTLETPTVKYDWGSQDLSNAWGAEAKAGGTGIPLRGIEGPVNWNSGGERQLTDRMFPDVGGEPNANATWKYMDKNYPGWRGAETGIPQGQEGIDAANARYAPVSFDNPNTQALNELFPSAPAQHYNGPYSELTALKNWENGPGGSMNDQANDATALRNAQMGLEQGSFQPTAEDTQVLDYVDSVANNPPPTAGELQDIYKRTGLNEGGPYAKPSYLNSGEVDANKAMGDAFNQGPTATPMSIDALLKSIDANYRNIDQIGTGGQVKPLASQPGTLGPALLKAIEDQMMRQKSSGNERVGSAPLGLAAPSGLSPSSVGSGRSGGGGGGGGGGGAAPTSGGGGGSISQPKAVIDANTQAFLNGNLKATIGKDGDPGWEAMKNWSQYALENNIDPWSSTQYSNKTMGWLQQGNPNMSLDSLSRAYVTGGFGNGRDVSGTASYWGSTPSYTHNPAPVGNNPAAYGYTYNQKTGQWA